MSWLWVIELEWDKFLALALAFACPTSGQACPWSKQLSLKIQKWTWVLWTHFGGEAREFWKLGNNCWGFQLSPIYVWASCVETDIFREKICRWLTLKRQLEIPKRDGKSKGAFCISTNPRRIARLSLQQSIGWVALSSLVVWSSRIGDISTYLHYMRL